LLVASICGNFFLAAGGTLIDGLRGLDRAAAVASAFHEEVETLWDAAPHRRGDPSLPDDILKLTSGVIPDAISSIAADDARKLKKLLSDAISMFIDAAENQDASITAERDGLVAAKMLLALVEMRKEQAARMKTLVDDDMDDLYERAYNMLTKSQGDKPAPHRMFEAAALAAYATFLDIIGQSGEAKYYLANTAALLHVFYAHHGGWTSAESQKFRHAFNANVDEGNGWAAEELATALSRMGWHDEAASMTATAIRIQIHAGYMVEDYVYTGTPGRCRRARQPRAVMSCYVAWLAVQWEAQGIYASGEGDSLELVELTDQDKQHLCDAATTVAGRTWCSVVQGKLPVDDPLAVAMRLRAVAEEGDCQLVAYLFHKYSLLDVEALRKCKNSHSFLYFADMMYLGETERYSQMAFAVVMAFIDAPGGTKSRWSKLESVFFAPIDWYQANYVEYLEQDGTGGIGERLVRAIETLQWMGDERSLRLARPLIETLRIVGEKSTYPQCVMEWCARLGLSGGTPA